MWLLGLSRLVWLILIWLISSGGDNCISLLDVFGLVCSMWVIVRVLVLNFSVLLIFSFSVCIS